MKTRCTFTATDSLQMLKATGEIDAINICSITTIGNILMRVSDKEMLYLCSLAGGTDAPSPNEFIEAQGWGSMNLASDVAIIVISEVDLKRMEVDKSREPDLMPQHLLALSADERRKDIAAMKEALKVFCANHGISLVYLPLGPDTMNSRERRAK